MTTKPPSRGFISSLVLIAVTASLIVARPQPEPAAIRVPLGPLAGGVIRMTNDGASLKGQSFTNMSLSVEANCVTVSNCKFFFTRNPKPGLGGCIFRGQDIYITSNWFINDATNGFQ